jgi:putative acetyltransferase
MIVLRPERPEDATAIREVHRLAFEGDAEAGIVDALRAAGAAVLSMVAVERPGVEGTGPEAGLGEPAPSGEAGQVVAHVLYTWVTETAEDGAQTSLLGLAPVAVLPSRQNQGIGTLLIEASLELLRAGGHLAVVVVGHPDYYPRFGFLPGSRWGLRWEAPAPNSSIQNEDSPSGCDGRGRGKDAGSARSGRVPSGRGATEDDASDRPVRTRRPRLRFESSSKGVFMAAELSPGSLAGVKGVARFRPEFTGA